MVFLGIEGRIFPVFMHGSQADRTFRRQKAAGLRSEGIFISAGSIAEIKDILMHQVCREAEFGCLMRISQVADQGRIVPVCIGCCATEIQLKALIPQSQQPHGLGEPVPAQSRFQTEVFLPVSVGNSVEARIFEQEFIFTGIEQQGALPIVLSDTDGIGSQGKAVFAPGIAQFKCMDIRLIALQILRHLQPQLSVPSLIFHSFKAKVYLIVFIPLQGAWLPLRMVEQRICAFDIEIKRQLNPKVQGRQQEQAPNENEQFCLGKQCYQSPAGRIPWAMMVRMLWI
ncbi:MAG TPA: hypothetical protein DCQ12_05405 [Candidatus Cloacimonas sp.]|nr:hypothetical protein [Candidatus Cloacimonas sp.]